MRRRRNRRDAKVAKEGSSRGWEVEFIPLASRRKPIGLPIRRPPGLESEDKFDVGI